MATNWATKDGFFACKVPRDILHVPNLGGIYVYGLTAGEKDDYEDRVMSITAGSQELKMQNARAVLMQMTVRNQHGNLMFGADDLGRLAVVPASIADMILKVARRLSGMATGEIETLVKNSQTGQEPDSDGSDSDSPDTSAGAKPRSESESAPTS